MGGLTVLFGFGWIAFGVWALNRSPTDIQLGIVVTSFAAASILIILGVFISAVQRRLTAHLPMAEHEN